MKKLKIITRPVKVADLKWDELFEEISHDWQQKAERLQARRWRMLRHHIKGISH